MAGDASDESAVGREVDLGREFAVDRVAIATVGAVVLGLYATWITADLVSRWLVFAVVVLGAGYLLLDQPDRRGAIAYAAYVLAGLLAATPILLAIPDVLAADQFGVGPVALVTTTANAILLVVFLALAAVVGYAGRRIDRVDGAGE